MASAQLLDGNSVAAQVKEEIKSECKASNLKLGLGTILVGSDPGSISYVNGKHKDCNEVGIESIRVELPETTSQAELISAISDLNRNSRCTGFIVQLPLPTNINTAEVLAVIDPRKDADGLHPSNLGALVLGKPTVIPCTPLAIYELAVRSGIKWQGKNVVVWVRELNQEFGRYFLNELKINYKINLLLFKLFSIFILQGISTILFFK